MKYQKTVPLNQFVMTIYRNRQGSSKARFRRRTFQEPNAVLFAQLGQEFRLWVSDFGTVLIQTPNFLCTEPNAQIVITYFVSSLNEISIFGPLNLVRLQLRSASESI